MLLFTLEMLMPIFGRSLACLLSVTGLCSLYETAAFADGSEFKVGVEVLRDKYREPIAADTLVDEHADYGSVTGSYTYNIESTFVSFEGRASYGSDNYKSPSGLINDIPQYEGEGRLLGGLRVPFDDGSVVIGYIGLGSRYFFDKNKGNVTSTGLLGYDRRILQFYIPIGGTMHIKQDDWIYSPNLEFDFLGYGIVKSRLGDLPGLFNIENTQRKGFGWRGEFMVGQQYTDFGWEAGPFFRYWNVRESDIVTDPAGNQWQEPHNTRLQAGAGLRVNF